MRARKIDANHREIADALKRLGWEVLDVHAVGGFVDLVAFHPGRNQLRLVEVKGAKGRYTPAQERLLAKFPVCTLRSVDDAINLR